MQLSASRWNQLMPINSLPRFVVFRYIKCQWDVSAGTLVLPDPSQPGIARFTCTWTLIDNFGNDQLARPCKFMFIPKDFVNLFFVQRNWFLSAAMQQHCGRPSEDHPSISKTKWKIEIKHLIFLMSKSFMNAAACGLAKQLTAGDLGFFS